MVVRKLVEDGLHDPDLIGDQHRRVERVGEPAQRGEGGRGPEVGVESLALERVPRLLGPLDGEVRPVGDPAGHGKPPRAEFEAVPVRGGEDEREGVGLEAGERGVGVTGVLEPELVDRMASGVPGEAELSPLAGLGVRVSHDFGKGHARAEDPALRPPQTDHVDRVAPGEEKEPDGRARDPPS